LTLRDALSKSTLVYAPPSIRFLLQCEPPNSGRHRSSRQCTDGPEYATSFGRTTHDLWAACVEPVQIGFTGNLPVNRSDHPQPLHPATDNEFRTLELLEGVLKVTTFAMRTAIVWTQASSPLLVQPPVIAKSALHFVALNPVAADLEHRPAMVRLERLGSDLSASHRRIATWTSTPPGKYLTMSLSRSRTNLSYGLAKTAT